MATTMTDQDIHTINLVKEKVIAASLEITFEAVLEQIGPASTMPDGKPFPMVIEPRPGGRWYRDLGDHAGHFWGHVQVIKPPTLLEICGPLFMSFPAINHLQYRLTAEGSGTLLKLTHRAFGEIPEEPRQRVGEGWEWIVSQIRELAERRQKAGRKDAK